jgi:hypothetical protein
MRDRRRVVAMGIHAEARPETPPAEEVSWLAIRQPAVVRMLEQRLWAPDGDAFAVGLDAVCRLLAGMGGPGAVPRLDHKQLNRAFGAVIDGAHDPALEAWVTELIDAAPAALTGTERTVVIRCLASIVRALAELEAAEIARGETLILA